MQAGVTLCASARIIAVALCLCLSVTSRSVETDEQIGLVFGMGASFGQSYTAF